jgi:hypothetical protein
MSYDNVFLKRFPMADGPEIDQIWQQRPNSVGKTAYDIMGK